MSFWDFVSSWPLWFQITFVIMLLILIAVIIKKGVEFTRGRFHIKIGNKGIQQSPVSPHKNCSYSNDILLLISELENLKFEKWNIFYIDQIRDQVNFAEQRLEQLRFLFQKRYLEILLEKNLPQVLSNESYKSYQLILKTCMQDLVKEFRISFKENHFISMREKEFSIFLINKVDLFIVKISEFLNEHYFLKKDISREELFIGNQELLSREKELFIDIFENARKVSIETDSKIEELDNKIAFVIQKYI